MQFRRVKPWFDTIECEDGLAISPEELWEDSVPLDVELMGERRVYP